MINVLKTINQSTERWSLGERKNRASPCVADHPKKHVNRAFLMYDSQKMKYYNFIKNKIFKFVCAETKTIINGFFDQNIITLVDHC